MSKLLQSQGEFVGNAAAFGARVAPKPLRVRASLEVRAEGPDASRRAALGYLISAPALLAAAPSLAAYGEQANIFGKPSNVTGYIPFQGKDYALLLPSKWNPSKEKDVQNIELRWEDNFDPMSHVLVTKTRTDKSSIEQFGDMRKFLEDIMPTYMGQQTFAGETISEGGFEPNKVVDASLLSAEKSTDKNGKSYYKYDVLVRAADFAEGGKHNLVAATVDKGHLYIMKVQVGDKRWFKGAKRDAQTVADSFVVG